MPTCHAIKRVVAKWYQTHELMSMIGSHEVKVSCKVRWTLEAFTTHGASLQTLVSSYYDVTTTTPSRRNMYVKFAQSHLTSLSDKPSVKSILRKYKLSNVICTQHVIIQILCTKCNFLYALWYITNFSNVNHMLFIITWNYIDLKNL
jgi:hypothetical protein